MTIAGACGPGQRDPGNGGDGDGPDAGPGECTGSGCATIVGKVWAPKWAPGDVPPGQEIPVWGATIYVTDTKPMPIPQQTFCEACIDTPGGSVQSNYDGSFELSVDPGRFWLVIKKGPFRLEQEIDVPKGVTTLSPQNTSLPSKLDPQNGAWIPKVAIVKGTNDAIEDILGKIGFGTMAGNKLGSADGEMTFYTWGGTGPTTATYLVQNLSELRKYHIIFFPCSTAVDSTVMSDPAVLKNIRQFVADGGKLYATDWSGEVADRAFPPQIELGGSSGVDSVGTYDPITLDGTLTTAGSANGSLYDSEDGKAIDPDLATWLGQQMSPTETNPVPSMVNPNQFQVHHNWNWIKSLNTVMKGTDDMGMPVYDEPKAWVTASSSSQGPNPVAVTYEPAGCGKVLFSTFQTSGASSSDMHAGLTVQERVLLFLIMEISACTQNPIIL